MEAEARVMVDSIKDMHQMTLNCPSRLRGLFGGSEGVGGWDRSR